MLEGLCLAFSVYFAQYFPWHCLASLHNIAVCCLLFKILASLFGMPVVQVNDN